MRAHIIESGKITSTIIINVLSDLPDLHLIDADLHPGEKGDLWNGTVLSKPPIDSVKEAANVRSNRDLKLAATDWTASTDVTMSDAMETYRQALRDVPAQSGFPNTITWPTEPGT